MLPLVDCADEPIRVPGAVQPHGVLLVASPPDLRVVMASVSAAEHLGVPAQELIGRPLADVVGEEAVPRLPLGDEDADARTVTVRTPSGDRRTADLLVHEAQGHVVVELEPHHDTGGGRVRAAQALRALQAATTESELTDVLVRHVREITGFDRVMAYRFDESWNGEVVAEDADGRLEPFLGLHYPASDIPAQARALYATQWLRSIPDAGYTPSPLVPATLPGASVHAGEPLDMSKAVLRSVSPVHLEYLANMGVRSSMSVSLMVHGRLWGLVACHHYAGPHFPDAGQRAVAEFLGRTASLLLQATADAESNVDALAVAATGAELTRALAANVTEPLDALTEDGRMLGLLEGVTGATARIHGRLVLVGDTPSAADVVALHDRLWPRGTTTVSQHTVGRDHPDLPADVVARASGVLGVRLATGGARDFLAWFRPEVLREVHWAGDPGAKGYEPTDAGLRLTPRASFAAWVEQVRGTAEAWRPAQVAAVVRLGQDVDEVLGRHAAEQQRIAAALRRVVLTERAPMPAGFAITHRFEPSGSDALGGDWFDVTQLGDGRVVLLVGDVAGHGIGVAAITAQVRNALRAYVVDEASASAGLERINRVISTLLPGELATVVSVELDPAAGEVRVCRAGHLPPLLVTADGARFLEGARGPALGLDLGPAGGFGETTAALGPGDCVVLYTDGAVEERGTHLSTSLEALREQAARVGPDREALADLVRRSAPGTTDDVTVVVLQREHEPAPPTAG